MHWHRLAKNIKVTTKHWRGQQGVEITDEVNQMIGFSQLLEARSRADTTSEV